MALFPDHTFSTVEKALLNTFLSPELRQKIGDLHGDYERLQALADRDREVLLEVLDTIGLRLDDLYPTSEIRPEECRAIVAKALQNFVEQQIIEHSDEPPPLQEG